MPGCCANGCRNHSQKKIPGITFHKFPNNPDRRNAWTKAVGRENWEPKENSCLCSLHFEEAMMDRTFANSIRLQKNAVPSIFDIPCFMKPRKRRQKKEPSNHVEEVIEIIVQSDGSVADPFTSYLHGSVADPYTSYVHDSVAIPCTSFEPISKKLNTTNWKNCEDISKLKKIIASLELRSKSDLRKIKTLEQYKLKAKRRIQDLEQNSKLNRLKIKSLEQYKLQVKRKIESVMDLIDPDLEEVPKPVRRRRKPGLPRPKLVPNAQTCPSQECPNLEEEARAISTDGLEKIPEPGQNAPTCPSQKCLNLGEEASSNANGLENVPKPVPNAQTCPSQKGPNLGEEARSSANDLEKVPKPCLPRLKPVQFLGIVNIPLQRTDANCGP